MSPHRLLPLRLLQKPPSLTHSLSRPLSSRPFSTTPSPHLARISLIGRLADTPELVSTSTGTDVVRYALGTSHGSPDNRSTSWWRVGYFGEGVREKMLGLGKG